VLKEDQVHTPVAGSAYMGNRPAAWSSVSSTLRTKLETACVMVMAAS